MTAASQTFTATGTWTAPEGVTEVEAQVWADSGGGGASGATADNSGGGGGGGGYSAEPVVAVTPGVTYAVTVGAGGAAGTGGTTPATPLLGANNSIEEGGAAFPFGSAGWETIYTAIGGSTSPPVIIRGYGGAPPYDGNPFPVLWNQGVPAPPAGAGAYVYDWEPNVAAVLAGAYDDGGNGAISAWAASCQAQWELAPGTLWVTLWHEGEAHMSSADVLALHKHVYPIFKQSAPDCPYGQILIADNVQKKSIAQQYVSCAATTSGGYNLDYYALDGYTDVGNTDGGAEGYRSASTVFAGFDILLELVPGTTLGVTEAQCETFAERAAWWSELWAYVTTGTYAGSPYDVAMVCSFWGQGAASTTAGSASIGGEISTIASWAHPAAGILDVASTANFPASGTLNVATTSGTAFITYSAGGGGGNQFTGCRYVSGSPSGTVTGSVTGGDTVNWWQPAGSGSGVTTVASGSSGGTIAGIGTWANPQPGYLDVASVTGLPSSGSFTVATSSGTATLIYTGISGSALTGCVYISGAGSGATVTTGAAVTVLAAGVVTELAGIYAASGQPATAGVNGGPGSGSEFDGDTLNVIAYPGQGGTGGTANGAGGAGGLAGANSVTWAGGAGANGAGASHHGGGGGGSAGTAAAGNNGSGATGGAAVTGGGAGGAAGTSAAGSAGTAPGGGGGGGGNSAAVSENGAAGQRGEVILTWTVPGPPTPYLAGDATQRVASSTLVITAGETDAGSTGTAQGTTAGAAIVVSASSQGSSQVVTGVTDSQGNTYAAAGAAAETSEYAASMWVALDTAALTAGTDTITVMFSDSTLNAQNAVAIAVPGPFSAGALDQAAAASGTNAAPSVTSGTLAQASETVVAYQGNATTGGAVTWAGGGATWLEQAGAVQNGANHISSAAVQVTGSTSAVTASGTLATPAAWFMLLCSLKLSGLEITTSALPDATAGDPYSFTLDAAGSAALPFTWTVAAGSLPAGISLSPSGVLSGTSPAATSASFTVLVTDDDGNTASAPLTLTVDPSAGTAGTVYVIDDGGWVTAPAPAAPPPVDWINAANPPYGAVGDDMTDDTAAIQSALSAASPGQVVYLPVPPVMYLISYPLLIPEGVKLQADGSSWYDGGTLNQTTLDAAATFSGAAMIIAGEPDTGLAGITLRGAQVTSGSMGGLLITSDSLTVTGFTSENVQVCGVPGTGISAPKNGSYYPQKARFRNTATYQCGLVTPSPGWFLHVSDTVIEPGCAALSGGQDGIFLEKFDNSQASDFRAEANARYGYNFSPGVAVNGNVIFTGCSTDANTEDGWQFTGGTGSGPVQLSNCAARRDGQNAGSGSSTYSGFVVNGCQVPVIFTGCSVTALAGDELGPASVSPHYGLNVKGNAGGYVSWSGFASTDSAGTAVEWDGSGILVTGPQQVTASDTGMLGTPYTAFAGSGAATGSPAVNACLLTHAVAKGDAVRVLVSTNSGTISGVADDEGNNYGMPVASSTTEGAARVYEFQLLNHPTGLTTSQHITVTSSATAGTRGIIIRGCAGITTSGAVDQNVTPTYSASGTAVSIGPSGTLAQASEWALTAVASGNPGGHPASFTGGFANLIVEQDGVGSVLSVADQVTTTTAALTASTTLPGTATDWSQTLVTLTAAAAASLTWTVPAPATSTAGTATLNGTTAVVVSTAAVTASSRIFLTIQSPAGSGPGSPYVSARTAGTSFSVKSTVAGDTSLIAWEIA